MATSMMQWIDQLDLNRMTPADLAHLINRAATHLAQRCGAPAAAVMPPMPGVAPAAVAAAPRKGAPPKGILPSQLELRPKWNRHIHEKMMSDGWAPFMAGRYTKATGTVKQNVPGSVHNGAMHVFAAADPSQCNDYFGLPPTAKQAIDYASHVKATQPAMYAVWLQDQASAPAPGVAAVAASSSSTAGAVQAPKAMTLAERQAKIKAEKAAAAAAVAAVAAKPAVAVPAWTLPQEGEFKELVLNGVAYMVDYQGAAFDENNELVGMYLPLESRIDAENIPDEIIAQYA
jgi:hypothetical protein